MVCKTKHVLGLVKCYGHGLTFRACSIEPPRTKQAHARYSSTAYEPYKYCRYLCTYTRIWT
jgi:hypothetical protein